MLQPGHAVAGAQTATVRRLAGSLVDLLLLNARVLTLDRQLPEAGAVAMRGGRVLAVGSSHDLRQLATATTQILDAEGGIAIPAFHDAHCHLLAYARFHAALDCRDISSIEELQAALRRHAFSVSVGEWVRGNGYDDALLGRHPDRHDLDAAVPDRPIRLQHRSLHLDVLNTAALTTTGVENSDDRRVERDPETGLPTGRLYSAGDLIRASLPRPGYDAVAQDMRRACNQLLQWGVTSVQDASSTNGEEEWELFHRLAADGHLRLRTFMFVGTPQWRELCRWRTASSLVRQGPVKLMLDEATTDPGDFRTELHAARQAGHAVAVHAVSEAEVATALDAFRLAPVGPPPATPDRLEHAAVVPDALLDEIRAVGTTVIGTPALVHERGDIYRREHRSDQHNWLHRAGSFLATGIPYAIGSDAPVIDPNPAVGLAAACRRATKSGAVLGPDERLTPVEALQACTLGPASAIGAGHELGRIRPGMIADIVVLDPEALDADTDWSASNPVRATILDGRLVWSQRTGLGHPPDGSTYQGDAGGHAPNKIGAGGWAQ